MNLLNIILLYIGHGETNYVNDISVFANNAKVCVINKALEMNLSGQLADSVGLNVFSGVGAQGDFLGWSYYVKTVNQLFVFFIVISCISCIPARCYARDTIIIFVV